MFYFTFRSVTLAQRAMTALQQQGVSGTLLRTPKALATGGCGYSIRMRGDQAGLAAGIFRREQMAYSKAFQYSQGQAPREVAL